MVKYEILAAGSSEKTGQYFNIDPDSGDISITDDLTQELFDEYKVYFLYMTWNGHSTPTQHTQTHRAIFFKLCIHGVPMNAKIVVCGLDKTLFRDFKKQNYFSFFC